MINGENRRKSKRLPAQRWKNQSAICNDVIGQNWSRGPCPTPPGFLWIFLALQGSNKQKHLLTLPEKLSCRLRDVSAPLRDDFHTLGRSSKENVKTVWNSGESARRIKIRLNQWHRRAFVFSFDYVIPFHRHQLRVLLKHVLLKIPSNRSEQIYTTLYYTTLYTIYYTILYYILNVTYASNSG